MTTPSYKRPESVLVVVYTLDSQVLVLERVHPAEYWQSVTGSLEAAESPEHAARRELREELGWTPAKDDKLLAQVHSNQFPILPEWRARYAPEVEYNTEYVFSVCLNAPIHITLNPKEHQAYTWLDRAQAIARVSSTTNKQAIADWVL